MHGDGLRGRSKDQIEVLKCNGPDENLIAHDECSAERVTLTERKLHGTDIRHPIVGTVRHSDLALLDFIELQLRGKRWRVQRCVARVDPRGATQELEQAGTACAECTGCWLRYRPERERSAPQAPAYAHCEE